MCYTVESLWLSRRDYLIESTRGANGRCVEDGHIRIRRWSGYVLKLGPGARQVILVAHGVSMTGDCGELNRELARRAGALNRRTQLAARTHWVCPCDKFLEVGHSVRVLVEQRVIRVIRVQAIGDLPRIRHAVIVGV